MPYMWAGLCVIGSFWICCAEERWAWLVGWGGNLGMRVGGRYTARSS
jgi:hypothetical protein